VFILLLCPKGDEACKIPSSEEIKEEVSMATEGVDIDLYADDIEQDFSNVSQPTELCCIAEIGPRTDSSCPLYVLS